MNGDKRMDYKRFAHNRALLIGVLALLIGVLALLVAAGFWATWRLVVLPGPQGPGQEPGNATGSSRAQAGRKIKYYQSTMLPGEISQKPARDSMGMDMMPVYETDETGPIYSDRDLVMAGVETAKVVRRPLSHELRANGKVRYNETGLAVSTARSAAMWSACSCSMSGPRSRRATVWSRSTALSWWRPSRSC